MRYSLDPELHTILEWRLFQNAVLDILLNEMIYSQKSTIPYRLSVLPDRRMLTDQNGRIVCEFSLYGNSTLILDWVRSWEDFIEMDHVGQQLREERLSAKSPNILI